jgi:hypothetical protein
MARDDSRHVVAVRQQTAPMQGINHCPHEYIAAKISSNVQFIIFFSTSDVLLVRIARDGKEGQTSSHCAFWVHNRQLASFPVWLGRVGHMARSSSPYKITSLSTSDELSVALFSICSSCTILVLNL